MAADSGAGIGVGVVALAEYTGVRDVVPQEVAELIYAIARGPGLAAMAVEAIDGNNTARGKQLARDLQNTERVEEMQRPT